MRSFFWYICFFVFMGVCYSEVRKPAVAGYFYPANATQLKEDIYRYLKKVPEQTVDGDIFAVIVPHAGYIYSGEIAAYAYKLLKGKKFDTIILIGSSHRVGFEGISVYNKGYFETPLGSVKIDEDVANYLIKKSKHIFFDERAHRHEHSLEVQVPFLQVIFQDFKIVPILFGYQDEKMHNVLKSAIVDLLKTSKKRILLIASTDMSHYHSWDVANRIDRRTLDLISNFDIDNLWENIKTERSELCGASAVITVMMVAKELGIDGIKILKYANSGDTAGDKSRVVGYTSIAIYKKKEVKKMEKEFSLSKDEKKKLLNIARTTLESYLRNKKIPEIVVDEKEKNLQVKTGAFVTLKKHGSLRGCIGNMTSNIPLYKLVSDMAIASATQDSRFPPVTYSELKNIEIEISVLSPLQKIQDINKIEVGKHGILIKKGYRSGVFLPQVATEHGWSRDEFLRNLCSHKMGLPEDCYKDKDAEIYIYTALVFSEKEIK